MLEIFQKAKIMDTDMRHLCVCANPCWLLSIITIAVTLSQILHLNSHLILTIISQGELININAILSEDSNVQKAK